MTSGGEERCEILFPKCKKGGHIVRKITVNPTYSKFNANVVDFNTVRNIYCLIRDAHDGDTEKM